LAVYRTTQEIFADAWEDINNISSTSQFPQREYCNSWYNLTYKDINLWELIYHIPGGISVYAAWNPYTEFYIIVHDLFKTLPCGIEQFYGSNAEMQIVERLKKFGVALPENQVWINPDIAWMYDKLSST
jgi:hypothetical protein